MGIPNTGESNMQIEKDKNKTREIYVNPDRDKRPIPVYIPKREINVPEYVPVRRDVERVNHGQLP